MTKHNLAFIDIESTGLDFKKHEIIEIGFVIVSQDHSGKVPKFEIVEETSLKIKPERIEDADPVALRVNKYDPADWVFAYTLKEAMQIFAQKTEGSIMVAHNLPFDFGFIQEAFEKTGLENKMHFHKLDTISVAFAKLHKTDVARFSLRTLCEHFGIINENSHTALADARATFELYKKLMAL